MDELTLGLKDAGCDSKQIALICRLYENGEIQMVIKKLRRHRCDLMERMHESQRKIDCVDFLLRKIDKQIVRKDGISNDTKTYK